MSDSIPYLNRSNTLNRSESPSCKKAALITGGSKRIGKAFADYLGARGWSVLIHYNQSKKEAEKLKDEWPQKEVDVHLFQADLSIPGGVDKLTGEVLLFLKQSGCPLELIINNASVFSKKSLQDLGTADLERDLCIHGIAPLILSKTLALEILPEKPGLIINMTDSMAFSPGGEYLSYRLSKRMTAEITKELALELAPHWRVNGIAPGAILPAVDKSSLEFNKKKAAIPLGRTGNPDNLVCALDYLVHADFVTGQILSVDGGERLLNSGDQFR